MADLSTRSIDLFWSWFETAADMLAANPPSEPALRELDRRVRELGPFAWEVGPGAIASNWLVVSPGGDRELLSSTRRIIARAPVVPGWEFHPAKQTREGDSVFLLRLESGRERDIDAKTWRAVLLRYEDGFLELYIEADELADLTDDERITAGAIALDGLIGEERRLEAIDALTVDSKFERDFGDSAESFVETALRLVTQH